MKTQKLLVTITAAAALAFIAGCDNKPAAPAPETTNAASAVATEVGKAVEAAAPTKATTVTTVVTETKTTATTTVTDAAAKANVIIDQAKALVGQNKYTEALTSLQSLAGTTLSADQEKIVTTLKEQIQKAMAAKATTDAAGAAGNLLKK